MSGQIPAQLILQCAPPPPAIFILTLISAVQRVLVTSQITKHQLNLFDSEINVEIKYFYTTHIFFFISIFFLMLEGERALLLTYGNSIRFFLTESMKISLSLRCHYYKFSFFSTEYASRNRKITLGAISELWKPEMALSGYLEQFGGRISLF